ncbi:MAG: VCBS repeat-containing protein, partial [Clostridiales bacterium]|nr:VCBS repeat-containing protein [Clostridiales bacterium]
YIAKLRYGFSLERVYGYYGTPSMAWELHYEEITGIANGSMQIFSQLCEEYNQIPSFTLIRNSYTWFQRAESVTYLCNNAHDGFDFQMDYYENAYSSGTHVDAGGQWLSFSSIEDSGSYFVDYPEYTLRAYPQAADLNSDGLTDIVCGSEDGLVYFCLGLGFKNGRVQVGAAQALTTSDGSPIKHGGYSAPQLSDLDGDGSLDLLCGWDDGSVRWFSGSGSTVFEPRGILFRSDVPGQALPHLADLNDDGVDELIVGSDSGVLMVYPGSRGSDGTLSFNRLDAFSLSKVCANANLGHWLAPTTVDWNGDGRLDLAVGTFDGYIAILLAQADGSYKFDSYISADEMNYKGTFALKFGNWAVPSFIDLNGDGQTDLLCGSQEYGMAYPIDSGYFPFETQLRRQAEYAKEHNYYVGVHFYTNAYASPQREAYELGAHKDALAYYGLDAEGVGANQHTWYTSKLGDSQSMTSIQKAGLKWQSGFASPNAASNTPQMAAENVVALPFFLMEDGQRSLLVQNNST